MRKPEVQRIIITAADDSTLVMDFVTIEFLPSAPAKGRFTREHIRLTRMATAENVESEIDRMSQSLDPELRPIKGWRFMDSKERLPKDRTFRNAWRDSGKAVTVNMSAAREIQRKHIRRHRTPRLAELDVAYQRADEQGDQKAKARIAKEKQRLRDLPADPRIEKAKTPEALKRIGID